MSALIDSDIAISTRVRLARNYTDLPFPANMTRPQFKKLNERIVNRLGKKEFTRLDMASLSPVERQVLVERHLASRELIDRPDGMLLLSKSETISVMAGEEDHLRVQCVLSGLRLEEMLDSLDAHGIRALFFFPPDAMAGHDDTIRRMIGSGHQVGFLVSGAPADALAQLDRGNGLLEHIARQRTCTVLADGDDALRGALEEAGWLCWTWNVDGRTGGRSASSLTGVISDRVGAKLYFARVLMDDTGTAPTALPAILRGLRDVGYDLRLAVETTLS